MNHEKQVDESWKESAQQEKEILIGQNDGSKAEPEGLHIPESIKQEDDVPEEISQQQGAGDVDVNFVNYVTSLGFQAMISLGEIPHPMTNQIEKNLEQAKFLIDTLAMMREKTKGNLDAQEENLLNSSVYELQLKYVDIIQKEQHPQD